MDYHLLAKVELKMLGEDLGARLQAEFDALAAVSASLGLGQ